MDIELPVDIVEEESPKKKTRKVEPENPSIILYKLNYRRPNGLIRTDIPKSVVYNLNVNWPDLLRVVPSDRWVSYDDVVRMVGEWENASPRKSIVRTTESIQIGLSELLLSGVLLHSSS